MKRKTQSPPRPITGAAGAWLEETVRFLERARETAGIALAKARYGYKLTGEQKYQGEAEYHRHCQRHVGGLLSAARGHARRMEEGGANGTA